YKGKRVLGLIPARGGSKGLPHKNIRPMAGKPLIAWTIEAVLASKLLDRAVVNTDDEEIAGVARDFGAEIPFMRPADLAGDATPMIDVVSHAIEILRNAGDSYDYLALFEPTSPLRKAGDIDNAIMKMIDAEEGADGIVSVGEVHLEHPSIMKQVVNDRVRPYAVEAASVTRRQDLGVIYFPYGVIYMIKTDRLLETRSFYQEKTIPYFIERWQNYEVDDIYDFVCIEAIMRQKIKEVTL
nr:acylneuraminate cytidylyltransferase family protein [bacterium]